MLIGCFAEGALGNTRKRCLLSVGIPTVMITLSDRSARRSTISSRPKSRSERFMSFDKALRSCGS